MDKKILLIFFLVLVVCMGINMLVYYLLYGSLTSGEIVNSFISSCVVVAALAWVRLRRLGR